MPWPKSTRPVKQKRALLESNPPRDNWIDGDEIKNVSPNEKPETFISEPEHALKNSRPEGVKIVMLPTALFCQGFLERGERIFRRQRFPSGWQSSLRLNAQPAIRVGARRLAQYNLSELLSWKTSAPNLPN